MADDQHEDVASICSNYTYSIHPRNRLSLQKLVKSVSPPKAAETTRLVSAVRQGRLIMDSRAIEMHRTAQKH